MVQKLGRKWSSLAHWWKHLRWGFQVGAVLLFLMVLLVVVTEVVVTRVLASGDSKSVGEFLDDYSPNVAVVLFELALVVGLIDWFAERERLKERRPAQRLALRRASPLITAAEELVGDVLRIYLPYADRQANTTEADLKRLTESPPSDVFGEDRIDLTERGRDAEWLREQLSAWSRAVRSAQQEAEEITAIYAPSRLAEAVETLCSRESGASFFLELCDDLRIAHDVSVDPHLPDRWLETFGKKSRHREWEAPVVSTEQLNESFRVFAAAAHQAGLELRKAEKDLARGR